MEDNINPLTGLPRGLDTKVVSPTTQNNINPLTGLPRNSTDIFSVSEQVSGPMIHEQVRLLKSGASPYREDVGFDLAVAQGKGELFKNSVENFSKNAVAGFVDAFGVTVDPKTSLDIIGGIDEDFHKNATNVFTKFAEDMRSDMSPIYQKAPDTFNPLDDGWWGEMFAQSGTSVGIMTEALVETVAVNALTAGLGSVAEATGMASKLAMIPKLSKVSKMKKNAMAWAGLRRYSESVIEAKDNGIQTYEEYKAKGKTDQEASKAASKVASNTFKGNMPLLIFDVLSASVMTSYNPLGKGTNVIDKAFNQINNKALRKTAKGLTGAASEGSEEFWQELVNTESRYRVDVENGMVSPNDRRHNDYLASGKAWNAFASGIFGSVMLGGIGKGLEKISDNGSEKAIQRSQKKFADELTGLNQQLIKDIGETEGDHSANKMRHLAKNKAVLATHLDGFAGNENSFNGYVGFLQDTLDIVNQGTPEELEAAGITNADFVKENYPTYLEDAQRIRQHYDSEAGYNDPDLIPRIVDLKYEMDILSERSKAIDEELTGLGAQDTQFDSLSTTGKQRHNVDSSIKATKRDIKALNSSLENLQGSSWQNVRSLIEAKTDKVKRLQEELKELNSQEQSVEERKSDDLIISQLSNKRVEDLKTEQESINSAQLINGQKLATLKDTEFQKANKNNKIKTAVANAETHEEVEQVKEELANADSDEIFFNDETLEQAEAKSEELRVKELTPSKAEDKPLSRERKDTATQVKNLVQEQVEIKPTDKVVAILEDPLPVVDSMSEEQRKSLTDYVQSYYDSLSVEIPDATFDDFISDVIDHSSKEEADELFDVYVAGWKFSELPSANFKKIYKKYFSDRGSMFQESREELYSMTQSESKQITDEIVEKVQKEEAPIVDIDDNNQPVKSTDEPYKIATEGLSLAYKSTTYDPNSIEQDDELYESPIIKSKKLLDQDKYEEGTKLTVEVLPNAVSDRVSIWQGSEHKGTTSFGLWASERGLSDSDQAYWDKIPMVVKDSDGDAVAYIHDTEFYNTSRTVESVIPKAIENARALRNKVRSQGKVSIEVVSKSVGQIVKIPTDQDPITLNQADPTSTIVIPKSNGDLQMGKESFEGTLVNKKDLTTGYTYEARKVGKGEYMALPVFREKLSDDSVRTVTKILNTYLKRDNPKLVQDILKNSGTGLDINNKEDLTNLLRMFIPMISHPVGFNDREQLKSYLNTAKVNSGPRKGELMYPPGTPFLTMETGVIYFGIVGTNLVPKQEILFLNPNKLPSNVESVLEHLDTVVSRMTQNVGKWAIEEGANIFHVTPDNLVNTLGTYDNYLKDNLKTNVKAFNIGSQDNPKYVTTVQPVINFVESGAVAEDIVDVTPVQEINTEVEVSNKSEEIYRTTLASLERVYRPNHPAIKALKAKLGLIVSDPKQLSEAEVSLLKQDKVFSVKQEFELVDYVFNKLSVALGFNYGDTINKQETLGEIRSDYFKLIDTEASNDTNLISSLEALNDDTLNIVKEALEEKLSMIDSVKENWSIVEEKAEIKFNKYRNVSEISLLDEEVISDNEEELQEKNYSKTSIEENGKQTASQRLKRFFAGINIVYAEGMPGEGFLGVPTYIGFDTVWSTVEQLMSSPTEMPSNYEAMIKRLEQNVENQKWLPQLIDKLNNADEQVKNEFVYNFARHSLSMRFVMFSKKGDDYTVKVYNTNATEINQVIKTQWSQNLHNTDLFYTKNGQTYINKEEAKSLLDEYNSWSPSPDQQPNQVYIDWLEKFGIEMSEEAFNDIRNKRNKAGKNLFPTMFPKSESTEGIFGLLASYAERMSTVEDNSLEGNPYNHPFKNASNVLNTLARTESKYSLYATTNSFRDGQKSIYGFTPTKHATDISDKLKFSQEFRDQLRSKSYNKHSYLLPLFEGNKDFSEKFYVDHIGITSLKEQGKKVFGDSSVTALSDADHEYLKLGLFFDVEQGEVKATRGENGFIGMRMARMFFPTMSDKSQMLGAKTAVYDFKNKHFKTTADEVLGIDDQVLEELYTQLVRPEMERITNFHSSIGKTNIKDYDTGAKMFLNIPVLNLLEYEGQKVITLMSNNPSVYNRAWFENNIKPIAKNALQKIFKKKVSEKLSQWGDNGYLNEAGEASKLNSKYFKSGKKFDGSQKLKTELAAYDYVLNSYLTNAQISMLFTGDPALYVKGKQLGSYFNLDVNGNPNFGSVNTKKQGLEGKTVDQVIDIAVKEAVGVNLGKRLALMLAPGNKLANSVGKTYKQVFLNDLSSISSNISQLVELFYPEFNNMSYVEKLLKAYNDSTDEKYRKKVLENLGNRLPKIADYLNLEGTDAQEYTTVAEHLNVLRGQGRLNQSQIDEIESKIKKGEDLNVEELKVIMQPIKPVYTGFTNDPSDVMRMMYVKSSSFPLIPQMTKGTELDKLRVMLEKYENSLPEGEFVRASYQTANKVGANSNALNVWNTDGTFNDNITDKDITNASLTLNRDSFRIQQDVPLKDKDYVRVGTQTLKLLFGNGIKDLDGFQYQGESISGSELRDEFNKTFDNYIRSKQKKLLKRLGVNEDFTVDFEKTSKALQDLLKEEATKRGYPLQDVEALEMRKVLNDNNEVVDIKFESPLWMSPNSNRYESLLNSIITNKLINTKLPGRSFVVGSEAGMKVSTDMAGIDQSKIVFTNKFEGELKAWRPGKPTQVYMKNIIKGPNGESIHLLKNGKPNPEFVKKGEGGRLELREGVIDEKLLQHISFRIPTSSHVSMANIEIVGILPEEVGDLMIVPSNLTMQKGLDFDIDKEFIYKLHSIYNPETKKHEVLSKKHSDVFAGRLKVELDKSIADDKISSGMLLMFKQFEDSEELIKTATDKTLSLQARYDKLMEKFDELVVENELVDIHLSVVSSTNEKVQEKINKVLSMDFAKSQAELIQSELEKTNEDKYFSLLDDTYQKEKMYLGASGKLGIGVYSNYVVFNSLLEQLDNPVQLSTKIDKDRTAPFSLTIGNQTFDGKLGTTKTLDNNRDIAEVFGERQNTATDNEKEQIMGKVNINELTINVDALLSLYGFDQVKMSDGRSVSVPYLLLSQPVIREYVEEMRAVKSVLKDYDSESKNKIVDKLKERYGKPVNRAALKADVLFNNLTETSNEVQAAVFNIFLEVDSQAEIFRKLQSTLNINNQGLGKSFFDTIDRYESVESFQKTASGRNQAGLVVDNATDLIGKYSSVPTEGAVKVSGDLYVTPTTPNGSMLVLGASTGYNLWNNYFPYDTPTVRNITENVLKLTSNENTSSSRAVEMKQDVFREIKKYLFSSPGNNIFTGSSQKERKRLFLEEEGKESLATYLNTIAGKEEILKSNKLVSRFKYKFEPSHSIIQFDNSRGENFDEDYLYSSLIELIELNEVLPDFQGNAYTTRNLATDLIAYSILEGGIQEAVQFVKYIPMSYLKAIGFTDWYRTMEQGLQDPKTNLSGQAVLEQYFQHNPGRLPKVTKEDVSFVEKDKTFTVKMDKVSEDFKKKFTNAKETDSPFYTSIYNPTMTGDIKYELYRYNGQGFERINLLGVFGMSEYNSQNFKNGTPSYSNVHPNFLTSNTQITPNVEPTPNPDVFGIQGGSVQGIIDNINEYEFKELEYIQNLSKSLVKFIPNDIRVSIKPIRGEGANGQYHTDTKTIVIDSEYLQQGKPEEVAKTFVKEVVHALTMDTLGTHVTADGKLKTNNAPKEVMSLVSLFNETKRHLKEELKAYNKLPVTDREKEVVYGATSIYEMVEVMMTEPAFQEEMKKVPYRSSGKSIYEKFVEIIDSLMQRVLGPDYKNNKVTTEIVKNTLSIIVKEAEVKKQTPLQSMEDTNTKAEKALNSETLPTPIAQQSSVVSNQMTNFEDLKDQLKKKNCK